MQLGLSLKREFQDGFRGPGYDRQSFAVLLEDHWVAFIRGSACGVGIMRIVIPGGSGQVGSLLARSLVANGHDVVVLSRNGRNKPWKVVKWDGETVGVWAREI